MSPSQTELSILFYLLTPSLEMVYGRQEAVNMKEQIYKPSIVAHTCNGSTKEAEAV